MPDNCAATCASGERSTINYIATAKTPPWPMPCITAQIQIDHSGAASIPSRPTIASTTRVTLSTRWSRQREANSGTSRQATTCSMIETDTMRSEERRVGKECVRRVDLGGRRIIKKKTYQIQHNVHTQLFKI